jgi:hypothetical protein
MADERHNPMQMQHAEFEALLADAIDGTLHAAEKDRFQAHAAACELCAPQYMLALEGRALLRDLPEMEPPAYLLQKVLNVTSEVPARVRAEEERRGWFAGMRPAFTAIMQPRFGMSFAMAFFSVMLILNVTGVKLGDLRYMDLRPAAVKSSMVRTYYETTGRAQKYYENLRFVYQVQSALRDLRNATNSQDDTPAAQPAAQPQPQQQKQQKPGDNTSEQQEKQQKNQRYSLDRSPLQLAAAPAPQPEIRSVLDDRRTA